MPHVPLPSKEVEGLAMPECSHPLSYPQTDQTHRENDDHGEEVAS